ncbi:MAG TPA: hypothetical protein VKY74_24390, partial [Chloroflexia bacterium]|nr:hypothetical protein [Chloroflexia bacterium]
MQRALDQSLAQLEAAGLLHQVATRLELEYLFRHALIQEAAYWSLLRTDRKLLHEIVAATLEQIYPDRLADLAPLLAYHFQLAGAEARARHYYMRAADQALTNYANAEAEAHYRAALALAPPDAEQAPLLVGLGEALYRASRFAAARETWRAAIPIYLAHGDLDRVARLYAQMAAAAWWLRDTPGRLALCREGLAAVAAGPETPGRAALLHELARAHLNAGALTETAAVGRQALVMATRVGAGEVRADALVTLASLRQMPPDENRALLRQAVDLAESAGLLKTARRAHWHLAKALAEVPDPPAARHHYQQAIALARRRGVAAEEFHALYALGTTLVLWSELAAATAILQRLEELGGDIDNPTEARLGVTLLRGPILYQQGDLAAALALLEAQQAEARDQPNLPARVAIHLILGELLLVTGAWAGAELALLEAIAVADPLALEDQEPRCLLSTVYARQGRLAEARQVLDQAAQRMDPAPRFTNQISLLLAQARLAAAEGAWPDALAGFAAGAALQAQQQRPWYRARTLEEWAAALLARAAPGDPAQATALLQEAQAIFTDLGVPVW